MMKTITSEKLDKMYTQAMEALKLHHFDEAITLLGEAAREGSIAAILRIAGVYYFGIGIEPNTDKAIEYLHLAEDNDNALVNLGHIYYEMEPTVENALKAWEYYERVYEHSSRHAFYLGRLCFEKRVAEADDLPILEEAKNYFDDAFECGGEPISGLYLWKINQMQETPSIGQEYLAEIEKRLMELNSPREYNNAAATLCSFKEYKMALPYIESCLSIINEEEYPSYLETYAEVLYGIGERVKAEKTYTRCMNIYKKECHNRELRWVMETMKEKFGSNQKNVQ